VNQGEDRLSVVASFQVIVISHLSRPVQLITYILWFFHISHFQALLVSTNVDAVHPVANPVFDSDGDFQSSSLPKASGCIITYLDVPFVAAVMVGTVIVVAVFDVIFLICVAPLYQAVCINNSLPARAFTGRFLVESTTTVVDWEFVAVPLAVAEVAISKVVTLLVPNTVLAPLYAASENQDNVIASHIAKLCEEAVAIVQTVPTVAMLIVQPEPVHPVVAFPAQVVYQLQQVYRLTEVTTHHTHTASTLTLPLVPQVDTVNTSHTTYNVHQAVGAAFTDVIQVVYLVAELIQNGSCQANFTA
jgi:hypothetical protein